MKHRIPHDLGQELARKATQRALETYRDEFPEVEPEGRWLSPDRAEIAVTLAGKRLRANLDVLKDAVDIDMDVPLVFRPFRKQAIAVIEKEILVWIEKARRGELD
ncbi:MAG: polyhydroxyalkanoic acid system family protein [Myxococcota bacterium]|nr:polyhydroxyalkanoic acid system family protein [Myxococcota bacterium]